jgi:hypothetical protein
MHKREQLRRVLLRGEKKIDINIFVFSAYIHKIAYVFTLFCIVCLFLFLTVFPLPYPPIFANTHTHLLSQWRKRYFFLDYKALTYTHNVKKGQTMVEETRPEDTSSTTLEIDHTTTAFTVDEKNQPGVFTLVHATYEFTMRADSVDEVCVCVCFVVLHEHVGGGGGLYINELTYVVILVCI